MKTIDIAEVARTTGLSARALRFYEARGLVCPLRTASGRRVYGAGELERLHQLIALKRAGLSLAQIKALFDRRPIDLAALLQLQLDAVEAEATAIAERRAILVSTLSRIDRGEPIDAATLCSLIRSGDRIMTEEAAKWKDITDRYMSEEAKADFARKLPEMGDSFSQADYGARWKDLGTRIKAAMPMDPASDAALGFVREWAALLEPFARVATPAMWQGSQRMYANMADWEGEADPGFDASVMAFIQQAATAAKAAGHDLGPLGAAPKG
ncbi:MerR family transcriptional regulator [Sphingomonas sp.]|uniref:MerR family transcriptional regulator n=1 Tax=Sphingomonas sp. TaxID=28214 RepID=UPI001DC3D6F6|nr:MerR family transcriptional regulator [Sphingomonas sp.]MBX9795318.1 MerR family transcriptional regulator [Sphingomonas sp.]